MIPETVQAIILGIVQGITEFLPVSSTAHLVLFPWFFGWKGEVDTLMFDVALHGGSLLALLFCFYRDWIDMFLYERKKLLYLAVAMVPAGVAGVMFHKTIEHTLRSPLIIVFSLTGFGIVMLAVERHAKKCREDVSLSDSAFIGIAQAIALIPGISRSGITITAGLFRGTTRESAARFSFLLSTPVIGGAFLLQCRSMLKDPEPYHLDIFAVGFIAAFVSGYFTIRFLMNYLRQHPLDAFVYYRFALAAVILAAYLRMG